MRRLQPVEDGDASLRLPPHSIESEQSLLGALFISADAYERIADVVSVDDFYASDHRLIFTHAAQVRAAGQPIDVTTVAASLRNAGELERLGGLAYLGSLVQAVPTAANVEHYAGIIRERALRRAVMANAGELAEAMNGNTALDVAELVHDGIAQLENNLARGLNGSRPAPLDLATMAAAAVPERRFRVGKIMPRGVPGLLTGHGGAGKTQLALHLACCLALEQPFFGEPVVGGVVAMVSTEDDAADLHYRLAHQVRTLGASIADLAGRLFLYDLTTSDPVLITATAHGEVEPTSRYVEFRAELRRRRAEIVLLDNFATLCAVDLIKPAHATQAIALCGQLVPPEGNAILIAHVDKATARMGHSREAYSGTAAFHNRARWRWFMFAPDRNSDAEEDEPGTVPEDDGRRIVEVQKVNAGRPGTRIPVRFTDAGALVPDAVADGVVAAIARRSERAAVLATIGEAATRLIPVPAAQAGRSTAHEVLVTMPSFPESLRGKAGKRRLFALLMQMRADRELEVHEFAGSSRHKREGYRLAQIAQ